MSKVFEEKDRFLIGFFFFFTCQPRSGLKQLIAEVQQQVLTGHAQKNRADSEEDASSHHPLTQTYKYRSDQTEDFKKSTSTVFFIDRLW